MSPFVSLTRNICPSLRTVRSIIGRPPVGAPPSRSWQRARKESLLALLADSYQAGRHPDRGLDQFDVVLCGGRQVLPVMGVACRRRPARQAFVHRTTPRQLLSLGRKVVDLLAVQLVSQADLQLVQLIQDVEAGDRERVKPVHDDRMARRDDIEPAAASRSPGGRAVLVPSVTDVLARLIV